ncbi:MAG: hypothetical protein MEQ07_11185 [Aquimonas sp.]|nr:hypothetical protein [Aquimonas sp.]
MLDHLIQNLQHYAWEALGLVLALLCSTLTPLPDRLDAALSTPASSRAPTSIEQRPDGRCETASTEARKAHSSDSDCPAQAQPAAGARRLPVIQQA